jgi:putative heme-binding domain-containing protein
MRYILGCVALLCPLPLLAQNVQQGFRVPPGFEVVEYADSKLANDIFSMTVDPKGRMIVSGPGYIRLLIEDEKTGVAAQALDMGIGNKEGAQGLFAEGEHLYYMADGGLRRVRLGADGKAAGSSELIRAMKTGGEHNAHAIRRGPDGWLYVLVGNTTGINKTYATLPTSPIKEPVAGCVLRFSPDLRNSEIVADGYRNAYDMDFNLDSELFTYDSDNERCVSLPWYEGTRFYHVLPGGRYGWRSPQHGQFWRSPPYFLDVVAPLIDLGRGSPTGVACYRHVQFPEAYRGGIFLADWTFGRIYFMAMKRSGASYTCEKQVFVQSTGDNGFAPTALAVHPKTGDLFVSIGGRGTRGAVYRIRYPAGMKIDPATLAKMRMTPRSLELRPEAALDIVKQAADMDPAKRFAALLTMQRHVSQFSLQEVRDAVSGNWDHEDRYLRWASSVLAATLEGNERAQLSGLARKPGEEVSWDLAARMAGFPRMTISRPARVLAGKTSTPLQRLGAVRLIQIALGDLTAPKLKGTVWEGYSARAAELNDAMVGQALKETRTAFPSGHPDLDRELSRTLAMLEDDDADTLVKVVNRLTAETPVIEDIHYLIVFARLRAARTPEMADKIAGALLNLDHKIAKEKLHRDSHWPPRIAELHLGLAAKDPKLNAALLGHKDFGRPDHALFTRCPGFDRKKAAQVFLDRAGKEKDYPWNADIVALLGDVPPEQSLPVLRRLWGQAGLEESIVPLLAKHAEPADRDKFLHGLNSPQVATVRLSLEALEKLPAKDSEPKHLLALIMAMRRLGDSKEEKQLEERFGKYLSKLTGQDKLGADKKAWADWFSKSHPDLAARLAGPDGVDVKAWEKRLAKINWDKGDAERGGKVYIKTNCASCHSGAQALGPDLHGVANRFSRADLLTAIIQPSKDIAPRYRTTQVETTDGKIYQGLVIYEAVDSLILQTGPAATIRLDGAQIASKRFTDISLMPAGLLDMVKDDEIADLLAYLKSLGSGDKK